MFRDRLFSFVRSSTYVLLLTLPVVAEGPRFNRDIRPILSENCFLCHGQDPEHRGGELRLDLRDEAVAEREEGAAIAPGDPAASELIKRIKSTDPDMVMPPPKSHLPPLGPEQVKLLEDWIADGAKYEVHWAFASPEKKAPAGDAAAHPVDRFIRERLAAEGLKPGAAADAETLVRRVYLDLSGLPPTPADVAQYVADPAPDRWERLLDRLMDSPHFAERMALPWLDAARYSDTNGFSIDDHRDMWAWRDWVIHAFQKNQPYDQFLIEQIAGDLIPDATPDQVAATGFLRNSMNTHEGGIIPEEYRVAQNLDRVDAVATATLGLTMRCAQCHDHKFDPISQEEYFRFYAFFNTTSEPGQGATNSNTEPVVSYTSPLAGGGMQGLKARVAELEYLKLHPTLPVVEARNEWEAKQAAGSVKTRAAKGFPWSQFDPQSARWIWSGVPVEQQDAHFQRAVTLRDGIEEAWIFATGDDEAEVKINGGEAVRTKRWSEPALADITGLLKAGENLVEVKARNHGGAGGLLAVLAWRTEAGWELVASDESWQARRDSGEDWQPARVISSLGAQPWGDVTRALREGPGGGQLAEALAIPAADRTAAHWTAINAAFIASGEPLAQRMDAVIKSLATEIEVIERDLKRGQTTVMVMDHKPELRKTHILVRGAYDQPGAEVSPGTPAFLPPMEDRENPTRLDLARWIARPENPLTARVAVNRMWQMIFGQGIVETAGDFGNQGDWPSHPELLDWLAVDLVENGWDLRHLLRRILTSETYRQAAVSTPEHLDKDPRNEWLSRSPRSRLPAEIIRDQALAVSGLLNPQIGGPSVHPLQPDGLWRDISHFGHPTVFTSQHFYPGRGPSLYRRSLYTVWKRTSPPPSLVLFDAPTRETCSVSRGRTNTPLQALVLMNDLQFVEAAVALGRRMIQDGGENPHARLAYGFRLATGRDPVTREQGLLDRALARHRQRYASDPAAARRLTGAEEQSDPEAAELAAYAMIGSTLINLDETITRP